MKRLFLIIFTALASLSLAHAQSFTVDPPEQSRSGLIRLRGPGFGNGPTGMVQIGSLSAPVARWQDDLIECYVPEGTPLGANVVSVAAPQGALNASVNVLPREVVPGRFKWRLKLPDQYVATRPIVGPDGTIYAMGNFGHIYAVNPDGTLRWVVAPAGGVSGCLGMLQNGNLVVGGGGGVQVLSQLDGSTVWTFPLQTPLVAGPSVGPDGNIYAADDSRWSQSVIGAFILSPGGQLIWSGGKYYRRGGGWTPQEVKFGGNNAYFWSDYSSTGDPDVLGGFNAIHLGGGLNWRVTDGVGIMPDSLPNGDVALFRPSTIEMWNANGEMIWSQNLGQFGGQPKVEAVIASDGRTYFTTTAAKLHAISPTGEVLYSRLLGGIVSNHIVRPDANQVALQYQPNFGVPAQIQGYDKNAILQWSQELPVEFGTTIVCYNLMTYDATGSTLYFGTAGPNTATYEAHCYLYALNPESGVPSPSPTPTATATPAATSTPTPTVSPTVPPTPAPSPTPIPTATATATPLATSTPAATATPTPTVPPVATPTPNPPLKAINLSTRLRVQTGNNAGIGGFIITGTTPKNVLIRGIGPSLTQFGVPDALPDPVLELHGPGAFATITNDNWKETQAVEIQNTGIPPIDDLESAIVTTLLPGAYTAIMRGSGNTSGVALVEVYDLEQEVESQLANLSTRAFVSTADNIVIAGFMLGDSGGAARVVVRGIGPTLSTVGVTNALADPSLELRDMNGTLLVANNDWQDDAAQAAEIVAAGFAPANNLEAAITATLPAGRYTALLAGLNNGTGTGLVEIYDLGP